MYKVGGGGLLAQIHNNSPSQLLSTVYQDYNWQPWNFEKIPSNFWEKDDNKKMFIEWAGKQLGVKELNDWHKITSKDLLQLGCNSNISLSHLLLSVYPSHNWSFSPLNDKSPFIKKSQYLLKVALKIIFPQEGMLEIQLKK